MDLPYILLFGFVLLLIYWFLTKNYNYWKEQNVPFVKNPIPGFGHSLSIIILRDSIQSFTSRAYKSTKSSMIGFYFMRRPALIVRDPVLVKCVLQTDFQKFRDNLISLDEKQDPVLSKHPFFTSDMNVWKDQRIHISNHLSGKKLQHLFVIAQDCCIRMEKYLDRTIDVHGGLFDCSLKEIFIKYTGEIVANAAFGMEGQSFQDNPDQISFTRIAEDLFKPTFMNGLKQAIIFYLPDFANFFRIKFMPDHVDNYFRENVKVIMKQRKQQTEKPKDFLQFCIDNMGEDDLNTLIADLVSFYGDVYETASSVLSHFFYDLSLNMEIQEKLRQHIVSKLNGKSATYESLKEMDFLDQVLNESLRLTPPFAVLTKICTEEVILTGSDGIKCHLKPGFPVFIPMMNLHQDEKYWPNSQKFDPERFNTENQIFIKKFTFFPFNEGPRMCVGMRLALMIMKLAVTTILTKYSLEPSTKTKVPVEIDPTSFVTRYEGGVWAKLKQLKDSSIQL